ncbi:alkaline phosphatase family protein [Alteromonas sp. SM 2104]|nr:alkaline phosphatase family protein [Alteromonas oceanisediminis]
MAQGELPNFSKLYANAAVHTTDANCDVEYLEPWIQWVTLHTGLPFEQHKVFRLGQAQNLNHESIWDVLSAHGKASWLCGSMNTKWQPGDNNITALPDPWSIDVEASPGELQEFYRFVRANVQEHTNDNFTLSIGDYMSFLVFMLRHGLSFSSIKRITSAVWKQAIKSDDRWKKATLLDWLQFDVFRHVYKRKQPAFATYFSNSTAHFQHKFWRYMEPERFPMKSSEEDIQRYGDAILYAYKNHDALIGKVFDMADDDTTIILSSALSQQPYTAKDEDGGRRFYRPHDMNKLPEWFGLTGVEKVGPVMSHQFHLLCDSPEAAQSNFERLKQFTFQDSPLFSLRLEGKDVFGGCTVSHEVDMNTPLTIDGKQVTFGELFYLADNIKSGMHHPHGVFWAYRPKRANTIASTPIPLESTMGMILNEFGISR